MPDDCISSFDEDERTRKRRGAFEGIHASDAEGSEVGSSASIAAACAAAKARVSANLPKSAIADMNNRWQVCSVNSPRKPHVHSLTRK